MKTIKRDQGRHGWKDDNLQETRTWRIPTWGSGTSRDGSTISKSQSRTPSFYIFLPPVPILHTPNLYVTRLRRSYQEEDLFSSIPHPVPSRDTPTPFESGSEPVSPNHPLDL